MTSHLAIAGRESEHVLDLVVIRLVLLEAECRRLKAG